MFVWLANRRAPIDLDGLHRVWERDPGDGGGLDPADLVAAVRGGPRLVQEWRFPPWQGLQPLV